MATGTVTPTTNNKKVMFRNMLETTRLYEFEVTSDASGDVLQQLPYIEGRLEEVWILINETTTPTTLFDTYLYNDNTTIKIDLLGGTGVNMSVAADNRFIPLVGSAYKEAIMPRSGCWLVCAAMGVSTKFTLQLYVKR